MGVCNSPDIFQEKISKNFDRFDTVRESIDDVIIITKDNFTDHLKSLDKVIQKLMEAGLKVNTENSFFGRTETEYLGLWVSKNGVSTLSSKLDAIKEIEFPTGVRYVRRFMGILDYYRYIRLKRANTPAPLTKLRSTKLKFNWTGLEHKAFEEMKKIVFRDALIS